MRLNFNIVKCFKSVFYLFVGNKKRKKRWKKGRFEKVPLRPYFFLRKAVFCTKKTSF